VRARSPAAIAIFFLLWLPADIHWLNAQSDDTIRQDRDTREWITTLGKFAKTRPVVKGFVCKGFPGAFHNWSAEGGVKCFFQLLKVTVPPVESPEGAQLLRNGSVAILNWDAARHRLELQTP
jgi:hypothetical protein